MSDLTERAREEGLRAIRWRWRAERGPLRPFGEAATDAPNPVYPHHMVAEAERDIAFLLAEVERLERERSEWRRACEEMLPVDTQRALEHQQARGEAQP